MPCLSREIAAIDWSADFAAFTVLSTASASLNKKEIRSVHSKQPASINNCNKYLQSRNVLMSSHNKRNLLNEEYNTQNAI